MDAGTNELADYIVAERDRLALLGTPVGSTDKDALSPYFEPSLLNSVRVVTGESIREPGFAARFRAAGLSVPEFSLADAVTLDRVIVAKQPLSRFTLFHELVHVVQWRILGLILSRNATCSSTGSWLRLHAPGTNGRCACVPLRSWGAIQRRRGYQ
jgi:hypothetical protein